MSHRVDPMKPLDKQAAAFLSVVNDVETTPLTDALTICDSPVCSVEFEPGGLIRPKRYCSDVCKMDVYALRRVRKLLEGLTAERVLEIVRG